jgi:hypothetical protein
MFEGGCALGAHRPVPAVDIEVTVVTTGRLPLGQRRTAVTVGFVPVPVPVLPRATSATAPMHPRPAVGRLDLRRSR